MRSVDLRFGCFKRGNVPTARSLVTAQSGCLGSARTVFKTHESITIDSHPDNVVVINEQCAYIDINERP